MSLPAFLELLNSLAELTSDGDIHPLVKVVLGLLHDADGPGLPDVPMIPDAPTLPVNPPLTPDPPMTPEGSSLGQ